MLPAEIEKEAERIVMIWDAIGFSNKREGLKALIRNLSGKMRIIRNAALEEAAKLVHGEMQVYEEQKPLMSKSRVRKIEGRWKKLRDIENRIRALKTGEAK